MWVIIISAHDGSSWKIAVFIHSPTHSVPRVCLMQANIWFTGCTHGLGFILEVTMVLQFGKKVFVGILCAGRARCFTAGTTRGWKSHKRRVSLLWISRLHCVHSFMSFFRGEKNVFLWVSYISWVLAETTIESSLLLPQLWLKDRDAHF